MAIFLCAVRRGEGLPTRPLDDAEDPSTVTVDGYDAPVGLLYARPPRCSPSRARFRTACAHISASHSSPSP